MKYYRKRYRRKHRRGKRKGRSNWIPYKQKVNKGVVIKSLTYPFPKYLETTLTCHLSGYMTAGQLTNAQTTNANGYGLCAVPLWPSGAFTSAFNGYPLSTAAGALFGGGAGSGLNPAGWKNLLYNTTLGTGIYSVFTPLSGSLMLDILPTTAADSMTYGICPANNNDAKFAATEVGVTSLFQAPGSVRKHCEAGIRNRLTCRLSVPQLSGIKREILCQSSGYSGTYGSLPAEASGFVIGIQQQHGVVTNNDVYCTAVLKIFGRFSQMCQAGIYDN